MGHKVFCNHLTPHEIMPPRDECEYAFRYYLDYQGWARAGYCYAYYPEWLRGAHSSRWMVGLVNIDKPWTP
jgi:hypothetical protein